MSSHHDHAHHEGHHHRHRRAPHKDWRLWGIVALMLAAMTIYLLTSDESITPSSSTPAAPVPASPSP